MLLKKLIILLMILFTFTACTVPQKQPFGANSHNMNGENEHIALYRQHEGPLTDLMIPDQSPLGIGQHTTEVLQQKGQSTIKNLGKHEGNQFKGSRIFTNRPGVLQDKYALRRQTNDQQLKKDQSHIVIQSNSTKEREIEKRVEKLQLVRDAHVISEGSQYVIGIESNESDREYLINEVKKELGSFQDEQIYITTNRKVINRIKALEHHVSLSEPFDTFGAAIAEIIDLIDDSTHQHR
ncbi:YhcN/YlaJ family sporulation lipoprotein [Bacillus sp. JCM 19034]|uniref:YhcN/YlaJ family sporulation lipoprotein n=1 Tax=Bacillus sp. JCM 19034 TaxID=1481928 RepID=UPI0007820F85|nr:YhcN/YlaJ family sporulation lipoprotein [Bacillus sp. JCM 19034]